MFTIKYISRVFYSFIILLFISGCGQISNPTPKDFLKEKNADIFQLDNNLFSNATDIDWVKNQPYTVGDEIGEITQQTNRASKFTDGTANVLPIGTIIFTTDQPFVIAVVGDVEITYLKMVEG